jgi:hypothetical protein
LGNNKCTLTLSVINTSTGKELVYRPFKSITAAFVGENETAGNPVKSPGVNNWVIQELLNGYDVHVYDDGYDMYGNPTVDCSKWGEGNALNEVANAINNQGIASIAILGYSHGGGTVYNLAWRMFYDGSTSDNPVYRSPPKKIQKPYNIVFTSYIDAVTNSNSINFFAENRKPLNTGFHLNQYQLNISPHGCSIPSSDDNLNRSGLGVVHSADGATSIDENPIVMGLLKERFEQKVVR